jgi:hypothetical protein
MLFSTYKEKILVLFILEYIQYADEYVDVVDSPSHMNYSNCEFILEIAKQFCVQGLFVLFSNENYIRF